MSTENDSNAAGSLWTADDVAKYLRVSRSWVYHRAQSGSLPCIKVGGVLRFEAAAIRAFVKGAKSPERKVIAFP